MSAGAKTWVYSFGEGRSEGDPKDRVLLGGKGAGLAEMTTLGLPVPPGFTITTEACRHYYDRGEQLPDGLEDQVRAAVARLEKQTGQVFGDRDRPLLVSVRSGARASMPGMMDTILNLGLNDHTVQGLIAQTSNPRFAYDSYRRFVAMYGDVVLGLKPQAEHELDPFEQALADKKRSRGVMLDSELEAAALQDLVKTFKGLIAARDLSFPEDPWEQLWSSIRAVLRSWNTHRAVTYRRLNNIPNDWGTAVNVCTMVFGNMGDDSATGVAFTRDPATGEKRFYGEYLVNAQGEDVVAGIRTPLPINASGGVTDPESTLEKRMPDVYRQLEEVRGRLEKHYRDMQDIEFTIQKGKLWLLQTRTGKRTAQAAVRIAVAMVNEGLIEQREAVMRVSPPQLDQLLHPSLDPKAERIMIAKGLPASPGAATGKVVFFADDAEARGKKGERVVLVRTETSPEDVHGMHFAQGILTSRGGMTSHAAVVARGMGRPCVVGTSELVVDYTKRMFLARGRTVREGDTITIDGATGEVMLGEIATVEAGASRDFETLMTWVDRERRLKVRANADSPRDAEIARRFGAEGIGLCRTEHMFFGDDRILAMRQMIMADDERRRRAALAKILPMQRGDFEGIFRAMGSLPVTIRLLDPPLHEFLPKEEQELREVARALDVTVEELRARREALEEVNPMLGLRGCRLGLMYPEIYEVQARAIFEAAVAVKKDGVAVVPEIMIPIVAIPEELARLRARVIAVGKEVEEKSGTKVAYTIGTMIELPRAALIADRIAAHADFFSFGTNDLTQTTYGFSRDDCGKFLTAYIEQGLLSHDPFVVLDRDGVGQLVKIAAERGRGAKPGIKLGICGEHGGDPSSVAFCHEVGLDYVSCSPFRVPIARLAAAQAALSEKK